VLHPVRPSVCLSVGPFVPCLRFSGNSKTVKISNLVEIYRWITVTIEEQILGLKVTDQGHWE